MGAHKRPPTPFASVAQAVADQGYKVIPIMPDSKSPGTCSMGQWRPMLEWQQHRDRPLGQFDVKIWGGWADANIGVVLGSEAAPGWEVVAIDIDTDDDETVSKIESSVIPSTVQKYGKRGYTGFYLAPKGIKGRKFKRNKACVFELLTGNGTRQTVIPPSIHPETREPYRWRTPATLATMPAADLPRLGEYDLERLLDTVEGLADVREEAPQRQSTRSGGNGGGSPHNALNTDALQDLGAWVPQLGLAKLKRTSAGFVAIPHWRANRKGWGDDQRNPSLAFSDHGIRDMSADTPHSPLDVVMSAKGCDLSEAFVWLKRQLGQEDDDGEGWTGIAELEDAATPCHTLEEGVVDAAEGVAAGAASSEPEGINAEAPAQSVGGKKLIKGIRATPFVWSDPRAFPRRKWLYGRHLSRQYVSYTVAPGGTGKSTLTTSEALCIATGKNRLGALCHEGPLRVWVINLEDPAEELQRKMLAACLYHKIEPEEIEGRIFMDSGRDQPVCVATQGRDGVSIVKPIVKQLVDAIRENGIDVLIIDPFVSAHQVGENDNGAIDAVVKLFGAIAGETNCAIELIHHVRKGPANPSGGYSVDDGRGGIALKDGARSGRVLNVMTPEEAERAQVKDCRAYFRANYGKSNMSPGSDRPEWYHLASQSLDNGEDGPWGAPADEVGVVEPWQWPSAPDPAEMKVDLAAVQKLMGDGQWREDVQTKEKWIGVPVAEVHGLDWRSKAHQVTIKALVAGWLADGSLVREEGRDSKRMVRMFIRQGRWAATP